MTKNAVTYIEKTDAYRYIAEFSKLLYEAGFIGNIPDANIVLNILCGHHLLIYTGSQNNYVRFIHQQFQEWFAADYIYKEITNTFNKVKREFLYELINNPIWEEILFFLIEHMKKKEELITYSVDIIKLAMKIDLVFASKLVSCSGKQVWDSIKKEFGLVLRILYSRSEQQYKDYALTSMLATRQSDFADIIVPLIENDNQQVRLKTYRICNTFPVKSIGNDWCDIFKEWSTEVRLDFIYEMFWGFDSECIPFLKEVSQNDICVDVRVAALIVLAEFGYFDFIEDVLNNTPVEKWSERVFSDLLKWLPKKCIMKFSSKLNDALFLKESINVRKEILSKLYEIEYPEVMELLKKELELTNDQYLCSSLIPLVFIEDLVH